MRYFTRQWCEGHLGDDDYHRLARDYVVHLERVVAQLPHGAASMARKLNLHDATLEMVEVDTPSRLLCVKLKVGDKKTGYSDAVLNYYDVTGGLAEMDKIRRSRASEVIMDEHDVSGLGEHIHRLIFYPEGEVEIRCRDVQWSLCDSK